MGVACANDFFRNPHLGLHHPSRTWRGAARDRARAHPGPALAAVRCSTGHVAGPGCDHSLRRPGVADDLPPWFFPLAVRANGAGLAAGLAGQQMLAWQRLYLATAVPRILAGTGYPPVAGRLYGLRHAAVLATARHPAKLGGGVYHRPGLYRATAAGGHLCHRQGRDCQG